MPIVNGMTALPIAPATGKLGVLTVGLGAVSSTLMAGVELVPQYQPQRGHDVPVAAGTLPRPLESAWYASSARAMQYDGGLGARNTVCYRCPARKSWILAFTR